MLAFLAGAVGTLGLVAYVLGTQRESLGAVAVTGAMFPAVSAGLLYRFGDHPLRWWQGFGIIGAVAGIALIAVG